MSHIRTTLFFLVAGSVLWLPTAHAQTCTAGQMRISGSITGASADIDIDCLFFDAANTEVGNFTAEFGYADGFGTLYNGTEPTYSYPCAPLNSATVGVPASAATFECVARPHGSIDITLGASARQAVSQGAKTANITITGTGSTTTTTVVGTTSTTTSGSTSTTISGQTTTTTTTTSTTSSTTNGSTSTTVTPSSSTTSTTAPSCDSNCDDADPCTDDSCVAGTCQHIAKTGLIGVQCRCSQANPAACEGQTIPAGITKQGTAACTALNKITSDSPIKKVRRLVGATSRAATRASKAAQKAVKKTKLTADCGNGLSTHFDGLKTGGQGLLTP